MFFILQQDLAFFLVFSSASFCNAFVSHSKYDCGRTGSAMQIILEEAVLGAMLAKKSVMSLKIKQIKFSHIFRPKETEERI